MSFQQRVQRAYTTGFPGDVINDGPLRAKPGIIMSATVGTDPAASTNRVSRVFGYSADLGPEGFGTDLTPAALGAKVVVGGAVFYGVLFHPKHYTLYGTTTGGPLAASMDLPQYTAAEFADMAFLVAELFNETTATKAVNFGDSLAYVPSTITVANNPQALPYGAIVSVAPGAAVPTGFVAIPNSRVINAVSLTASSVGEPVSGWTKIQLTM